MKKLVLIIIAAILVSINSYASSELMTPKQGTASPINQKTMTLASDKIVFKAKDGHKQVLYTNSVLAKAIYNELISNGSYQVWSKPDKADGTSDSVNWMVQELDPRGAVVNTMTIWEFAEVAFKNQRSTASSDAGTGDQDEAN